MQDKNFWQKIFLKASRTGIFCLKDNSCPLADVEEIKEKQVLEVYKKITSYLEKNEKINSLNLSHYKTIASVIEKLTPVLIRQNLLTAVFFANTLMVDETLSCLVKGLSQIKTLMSLDLSRNNISDGGAIVLSQSFLGNTMLQVLNLSANKITSKGIENLFNAFQTNQQLELNLAENLIENEDISILCKILPDKNRSKILLAKLNFSVTVLASLSHALKGCSSLTKLDIAANNITVEGIKVFDILSNSSLTYLNLAYNLLGDEGAIELASRLANSKLKVLNLLFNKIGDSGIASLATALAFHTSIREVDLTGNQFNDNGAKAIKYMLKNSSSLLNLSLGSNSIEKQSGKIIIAGLNYNKTLRYFDLSYNAQLGDENALLLAKILANHPSLQYLNMKWCPINNQAIMALTNALNVHPVLNTLYISAYEKPNEVINLLPTCFKQNLKVTCFLLDPIPANIKREIAIIIKRKKSINFGSFLLALLIIASERNKIGSRSGFSSLPCEIVANIFCVLALDIEQQQQYGKMYHQILPYVEFTLASSKAIRQRIEANKSFSFSFFQPPPTSFVSSSFNQALLTSKLRSF